MTNTNIFVLNYFTSTINHIYAHRKKKMIRSIFTTKARKENTERQSYVKALEGGCSGIWSWDSRNVDENYDF